MAVHIQRYGALNCEYLYYVNWDFGGWGKDKRIRKEKRERLTFTFVHWMKEVTAMEVKGRG